MRSDPMTTIVEKGIEEFLNLPLGTREGKVSWLRQFAKSIEQDVLERVGREWEIRSTEVFWGRFDEYKIITDWSKKLMDRVLERVRLTLNTMKVKI